MDVTREITLPLDREDVWRPVCDLERWIAEDADVALEPGAEGELTLPGGETRRTTIADVREHERLSFWWRAPGAPATFVEVELTDAVAGTRVVVTESGYADALVCRALPLSLGRLRAAPLTLA